MKSQCRLIRLFEQSPRPVPHGSREHNPKRVLFTHENKGKKYPYASERQNTRYKISDMTNTQLLSELQAAE